MTKVGIFAIRTKDIRLNRHELITDLQKKNCEVVYIGQESEKKAHPDYEKYGVSFISIPLLRVNTKPIEELKAIKKAKKILKENKIDILIIYGIRTFPVMVIAAKLAGVKKILCVVNGSGRLFKLEGLKGRLVQLISFSMLRVAFSLSDKILIQNQEDVNLLKKKNLLLKNNYEKINGSGVNLNEFQAVNLEKNPVFSMISRLVESKGVNEYIQAAKHVRESFPEAKFYLIGPIDESDNSINIQRLKKAVNEEIIYWIGKVEDVRPYLRKSRIFVLPSYYPEGIPRSILEAMAMGRPIITTDSPGCRETVIESFNGYLVSPMDYMDLAEKMKKMIVHQKHTELMGANSRVLCEKKFDVDKINNKILKNLDL